MPCIKKLLTTAVSGTILVTTGACAQQTLPSPLETTMVAASEVEMGGPALWKVADEDTTIYLFGTVHALPDDVDWYSGPVAMALDNADELVTEIDMTPESMGAMGALVASKGMFPAGETLRSKMTDEQRATYEAALAEVGLPAEPFDQMEPWFATLALANQAMAMGGFNPANGVETVLEKTIKEGTARGALETIEFQIAIFDELPMESQIEYLLETVEGFDEIEPMLQRLVDEWAAGDAEELGALMNEAMSEDDVLSTRLLTERNANWAEWIDTRLDTPGTVFMAVGAGHLAGDDSVQEMLEERGIENVRVQ